MGREVGYCVETQYREKKRSERIGGFERF